MLQIGLVLLATCGLLAIWTCDDLVLRVCNTMMVLRITLLAASPLLKNFAAVVVITAVFFDSSRAFVILVATVAVCRQRRDDLQGLE